MLNILKFVRNQKIVFDIFLTVPSSPTIQVSGLIFSMLLLAYLIMNMVGNSKHSKAFY